MLILILGGVCKKQGVQQRKKERKKERKKKRNSRGRQI
jgi:hypothetical protein